MELLQSQSNVKLVGYTAQPLHDAVDAAIDELLDRHEAPPPPHAYRRQRSPRSYEARAREGA